MKKFKVYREWVYKISFWLCNQIAAHIGLILSGDCFYKEGAEFEINITELKGS